MRVKLMGNDVLQKHIRREDGHYISEGHKIQPSSKGEFGLPGELCSARGSLRIPTANAEWWRAYRVSFEH